MHNSNSTVNGFSFLVLYAQDMAQTLRFYSALGLDFKSEQHGAGPKHYCCQIGDLALEIYPAMDDDLPSATGMIGLSVQDLDEIPLSLEATEPYVVSACAQFGDGRRCVIKDPDGTKVFLFENSQSDGPES